MSEIKPHYSNTRSILADVIPLSMPYSVQIEPSQICNLKCNYCVQSFVHDLNRELMTGYVFSKLCDRLMEFDGKLKQVNFAGWGDPLVNPGLSAMVNTLRACDVTENIAVVTNGLLLTRNKSKQLIDAGLNHLRISLQGIWPKSYKETCGKWISVIDLLEEIQFFYEHRGQCKVSVKIADTSLAEGEEQNFFRMFEDITDQMYIEQIRPMFKENEQDGKAVSKYGIKHPPVLACPLPFYMMAVTATGDIIPCCSYYPPEDFGNIDNTSLKSVWESERMKWLYEMMLTGNRKKQNKYPVCRDCLMPDSVITPGDELDERAEEIKERL